MLVSEATLLAKRSSSLPSVTGNDVFSCRWKLIDFIVMVDCRSSFYDLESMRFAENAKFWTFESTYKYLFLISDQINTLIFAWPWVIFKTFVFLYYVYSFWSHCERWWKMDHFLFLILHNSEIYCCRAGMVMDLRFQIWRSLLTAAPKWFSTMFCKLVIFSRIIVGTAWSLDYFTVVLNLFRGSYDSFLFW